MKSCNIFMSAGFSPGIFRPFLIRRMRRIGSISAPTFSSKPRMNATEEGETRLGRSHAQPTWPSLGIFQQILPEVVVILVLGKIDRLWQICEGLRFDATHIRTLFTSPRRSIIRCNAFLLSPILPSKNTISGTRSRSVQILYAYREVNLGS